MPHRVPAPFLLVLSWYALVSAGVAMAALASPVPPSWDALMLLQEARSFWTMVADGPLTNPFALEPAAVPPAATIVSYPFGFTPAFHWFHARSVIIPVGLLLAAVYVAGWRAQASRSERLTLAALALVLGGMPMLYQFAPTDMVPQTVTWGMLDAALTGWAALAFACSLRAARSRSVPWSAGASIAAGLCMLTAPGGTLLALLAVGTWAWLTLGGADYRLSTIWRNRSSRAFALASMAINLMVLTAVGALGLSAGYFSAAPPVFDAAVAAKALHVLEGDAGAKGLGAFIRIGMGWPALALIIVGLVLGARRPAPRAAGPAIVVLIAGAAAGLVGSGVLEPRDMAPFAAAAAVLLVPDLTDAFGRLPDRLCAIPMGLAIAPTLAITVLVFLPAAPAALQAKFGISVARDQYAAEREQAYAMLSELGGAVRPVRFLAFAPTARARSFLAVLGYAALTGDPPLHVTLSSPFDRGSPAAHRFADILKADYLVFAPIRDAGERAAWLERRGIPGLAEESRLLHSWFTMLSYNDGVGTVSETGLRVLKVLDRDMLNASLARLRDAHDWSAAFVAANPAP